MSRTAIFLGIAVALSLVALLATRSSGPLPPQQQPYAVAQPAPQPVAPQQPAAPALAYVPVTAKDGALSLEAKLSNTYVAQGTSEQYLEVNLAAAEVTGKKQRVPVNLVLVLDRSGSMSGQKLEEARRAAHELVGQLQPTDRLAIVDFGSDVRTLASQRGDGAGKARLSSFIEQVRDNGGTNIAAALDAARDLVKPLESDFKSSRIILLSDGQPTEGVVDGPSLARQVAGLHEQNLTVSAIGVGVDFNGPLMKDLAQQGAGFYGFIDDPARLAEVFRRELDEAGQAVARNIDLRLQLPDGVELVEVFGRSAVREGTGWKVPMYDFSPGQTSRVTARLTVRSGAAVGTPVEVARVQLAYSDLVKDTRVASSGTLLATVSDDAALVRRTDQAVTENANRAVSAQQLTLAAAAYERGDRASAFGILDNMRSLFGMSADALAGDDLGAVKTRWAAAKTGEEVRYEAKSMEKKAMKNFGENNAY
ncbi:MAG: vWA domain-containing protein, partial [Myxococcaceae bacterium]